MKDLLVLGPVGPVLAGIWGALWGSFFNVVIVRVPRGGSIVSPPSHCQSCQQPLRWYDNIPVLSYGLLRGRCRHCGARYSPRYMLVEILMALLAVAAHRVYLMDAVAPFGLRAAQFVIVSLFIGLLVAVAFIDLATFRIPNAITYPAIPAAVALSLLMAPRHLWDGLVGAVAGYLLIRLIADGWQLATGRQGMGYGDAKLLAVIGGLLGWQALLPVLLLASLQGSVIGIGALLLARSWRNRAAQMDLDDEPEADGEAREPDPGDVEARDELRPAAACPLRYAKLPFGPFLSLAAIEVLLLRQALIAFFPYL